MSCALRRALLVKSLIVHNCRGIYGRGLYAGADFCVRTFVFILNSLALLVGASWVRLTAELFKQRHLFLKTAQIYNKKKINAFQ